MKVNVVGPYFGSSGYSTHLRNLTKAVKKINSETSVETQLPQDYQKLVENDEEYELLSQQRYNEGWQVMITNPLFAQFKLGEYNKGVLPFMIFEGDTAPKQWGIMAKNFKKVLVPSSHNKQALTNVGIPENHIALIPHGINPEEFNTEPVKENNPFMVPNKCTFVWNKGWSKGKLDRSGFHYVLQAFLEEFRDEEPVRLLAHINPAYNNPEWNVEEEIKKLRIPKMMTPPKPDKQLEINITSGMLPTKAVKMLYHSVQYFIGCTRADAFNIPVLEAMACGLPCIVSTFGGHLDYVHKNCWKVGGTLEPAPISDLGELALYEQTRWLDISVPELRKALRESYELWKNNKDKYQELCKESAEASKNWTWENSAKKLVKVLQEIEVEND